MADFTLTIAEDHVANIAAVAKAARAAGLRVEQVLDQVGVICGSAPVGCAPALRDLDGVDAVEQAHSYRVAPPDSAVQ